MHRGNEKGRKGPAESKSQGGLENGPNLECVLLHTLIHWLEKEALLAQGV